MKRTLVVSALAVLLTQLSAPAASDFHLTKLEKAKKAYKNKIEEEGKKLIKAYDKAIAAITKKGDLEAALIVKQEKEDFVVSGALGDERHNYVELTSLTPKAATVGWGTRPYVNERFAGNVPMLKGKPCEQFIVAHAASFLQYDIPKGAKYFSAIGCSLKNKRMKFKVRIHGKMIFASKSLDKHEDGLVRIKVPIPRGAKTIDLLVDKLGTGQSHHSCWLLPRFYGTFVRSQMIRTNQEEIKGTSK